MSFGILSFAALVPYLRAVQLPFELPQLSRHHVSEGLAAAGNLVGQFPHFVDTVFPGLALGKVAHGSELGQQRLGFRIVPLLQSQHVLDSVNVGVPWAAWFAESTCTTPDSSAFIT